MKVFEQANWCTALLAAALASWSLNVGATGGPTGRDDSANLYIIGLHHGEKVQNPVRIRFGLSGMGVAPAGIDSPNTGHHHLLIDVETLPDLSQPLPSNEHVRHFGKGQTETLIELSPGKHSLRLVLGDHMHRPHAQPLMSEPIVIEVVE